MKKSLLLLLAAMLLPMAIGAQKLAPSRMDLADNQLIMGHYTTDDIALGGCWGKTYLTGGSPIATDLSPEELAFFQGSKIVAFRVGMSIATPVTSVFLIPIDGNGNLGEMIEWPCEVGEEGWNIVELDTPYLINLPSDYQLRIGFVYNQQNSADKPISAVNVGTIYPSYTLRAGRWQNYGLSNIGNLSLQCIVENDNFPSYVILMRNLTAPKSVKNGDNYTFTFQTSNIGVGQVPAGGCTYEVAIDGNVVSTFTNPDALTSAYTPITKTIPVNDVAEGYHTLTLTAVSVNGEAIENPPVLSFTFKSFDHGFARQMRLVEQFTSVYCTFCPNGTAMLNALCDLRGDIAWVAIHENMGETDPFRTAQCDSLETYQHCTGYPEGSFDRYPGPDSSTPNEVCTVINFGGSASQQQAGANYLSSFLDQFSEDPSHASVFINSTYDEATRKATITVNGELIPDFDEKMGADSRLTVYITEDGLVAPQVSGGNDYVHNNVLRFAPGGVRGVALKRNGDTYENEFVVNIPTTWNPEKLSVVAFISRPLRSGALTDLYVTNANKRKLGEKDEPQPTFIPGDLDGNEILNISDVTLLIQYVLTGQDSGINIDAADYNGDGTTNISDVTEFIQYILANG